MDSLEETRFPVTWSLEELILDQSAMVVIFGAWALASIHPNIHIYNIYQFRCKPAMILAKLIKENMTQKNTPNHQIHINHKPDAASRQEEHRTKSQCVPQSQPRDRHVSRDLNLKNHFSAFVLVSIKCHWSFIRGNNKCPQGDIIHHSSSIIIHHPCTR